MVAFVIKIKTSTTEITRGMTSQQWDIVNSINNAKASERKQLEDMGVEWWVGGCPTVYANKDPRPIMIGLRQDGVVVWKFGK